jgi:hypothetical protein
VDYVNGVLTLSPGAPDYGTAGKSITFKPAAAPARSLQTASWPVTTESRSQTLVAYLDPIPQPGTVRVHFRAGGRWYVLQERGTGKIAGADEAYGAGSLSVTTGSLIVTLGALPDVGSSVIVTYGLASNDMLRAGLDLVAEKRIELPDKDIAKLSLTLSWPDGLGGTYAAADNGSGLIVGDATGWIDYPTGTVLLRPTVLPPKGADIDIEYSINADANTVEVEFTDPARDGTGKVNLLLPDTGIVPGSITLSWSVDVDETSLGSAYVEYAASIARWSAAGWYLSNVGSVYTRT